MKFVTYTKQDLWIAIGFLPVYILLMNYLLLGPPYFSGFAIFAKATIILFIVLGLAYQFLHTRIADRFRNRYSNFKQTPRRMLLMIPAHILVNVVIITALFSGYQFLQFPGYTFNVVSYKWALALGASMNIVVTCIHEGVYAFELWQQKLLETEKLRKANLQSQFESLKQQINPHFLFNCLNSLSSLIEEDPEQANRFIEEMSNVYRYLLRSNESELATLESELRFANSYFHLLSTRYGPNLQLEESIDPEYKDYMLPPLTLQLLMENVVKHNVIMPQQPLFIQLKTTPEGKLVVTNNLQKKTVTIPSSRIGLANIASKYSLLGQGEISIEEDQSYFSVKLPLLTTA
ncbi:MAG: histidine kinase [Dyadobacter sp.]|uniref:sensor histidine kinase n=1 Tax=Dyadobacter sp. TaxID=1914288 RepID=UPI00326584A4